MSGNGRRNSRLPKDHPNYHKQLAQIRRYYDARRGEGEPPPGDDQFWEDLELDEDELAEIDFWTESYQYQAGRETREAAEQNQASQRGTENPRSAKKRPSEDIREHFKETKKRAIDGNMAERMDDTPGGSYDGGNAPIQQGGGGGGGGSGAGNNGGSQIEEELKFGKPAITQTRHYKKSYLVNITNGHDKYHLEFVAADTGTGANTPEHVRWCEGFQIIPWGDLRAYLYPIDYYELFALNRKFRIKSAKVTMEGIIPFQVDLLGQNTSTATFNNRINIHAYTDDGELLPDLEESLEAYSHSNDFALPYGDGNDCTLSAPKFTFFNATRPDFNRYCPNTAFENARPQRWFSLYDTGRVKSVYPGQKLTKTWRNSNTQWVGRAINDNNLLVVQQADAAADRKYSIAEVYAQSYRSGLKGEGNVHGPLIAHNDRKKSNYADTGRPIAFDGPPYLLVKVEPYPNLGAGGGLINIYAQAHLHYELEVEMMALEKPRQYVPIQTGRIYTQGTDTNFAKQVVGDCALGLTDNKIHRVFGTQDNDIVYT